MTEEQKKQAAGYIRENIQDEESLVAQAMAWGAFQALGRIFNHTDVYECVDRAQASGHSIRNPIRMLVDK